MERSQKGLSFFRSIGWFDAKRSDLSSKHEISPSVKVQLDKETYRPGDSIIATVQISTPQNLNEHPNGVHFSNRIFSFLLDDFSFEIKGIEKLDRQWFTTPKPSPGSKQRRGECFFLDCTASSIVSRVIISSGCSKTYIVRVELPKILPPSYKGISIRYIYYVRCAISGRWFLHENNDHNGVSTNELIQVHELAFTVIEPQAKSAENVLFTTCINIQEARLPLQILISQKSNNFLNAEGNLPISADQLDIFWKEKDSDTEWIRANEYLDVLGEGYDSSKDEVSSVSSYNPGRGNTDLPYHRSSSSLYSIASRLSNNDFHQIQAERYAHPTQLSVAEVVDDLGADNFHASYATEGSYASLSFRVNSSQGASSPLDKLNDSLYSSSPCRLRSSPDLKFHNDESSHSPKPLESSASEGFIRLKSYNIKFDDQILLKFSPKNYDSTYYFGDMVGGTLTFFHGGIRRCLEVTITLEIAETIAQNFVHPSRRSSPSITKVQSEHHEIVADLNQTSFLLSIPIDGPMSFSTPKVSVQWSLRFEFFTITKDFDLTRYEHPLLAEQRQKGEWVIPVTVHAPPLGIQPARTTKEKAFYLGNMFNA